MGRPLGAGQVRIAEFRGAQIGVEEWQAECEASHHEGPPVRRPLLQEVETRQKREKENLLLRVKQSAPQIATPQKYIG